MSHKNSATVEEQESSELSMNSRSQISTLARSPPNGPPLDDGAGNKSGNLENSAVDEIREYGRFCNVKRKKDFVGIERSAQGKMTNILDGLELHRGVFDSAEQSRIVSFVEHLVGMGNRGRLKGRTFSAPRKWMRGKGRVTLQFGCCYNYATDKIGNPPGILKNETVDPLPHLFKSMIKRLVRWHVLPPSCVPDSCIVNIYEEGDCIPPHIDNHDFVRPFCTVSFLSECEILLGSSLKVAGPGEFSGSYSIPLPLGSVLVLNGNAADIAKHCVPAVPTRRISITFRKMDESKLPRGYVPEPDFKGLRPLPPDESSMSKKNERSSSVDSSIRGNSPRKSQVRSEEGNYRRRRLNSQGHDHDQARYDHDDSRRSESRCSRYDGDSCDRGRRRQSRYDGCGGGTHSSYGAHCYDGDDHSRHRSSRRDLR